MSGKLQGKVALITGGAGGLGLGISMAYGAAGAKVALVGRNAEKLAAGKAEVEGAGGECITIVADMSSATGAAEAIAAAEQSLGPIDVVVNSAGVFIWKKFLDLEPADWEGTLKSNLSAAFYTTQAFARTTAEKERQGAVINISSIHGVVGDGGVVPHCASKFGLLGLTEASAEALRPMDPGQLHLSGINRARVRRQNQRDPQGQGYPGRARQPGDFSCLRRVGESDRGEPQRLWDHPTGHRL